MRLYGVFLLWPAVDALRLHPLVREWSLAIRSSAFAMSITSVTELVLDGETGGRWGKMPTMEFI